MISVLSWFKVVLWDNLFGLPIAFCENLGVEFSDAQAFVIRLILSIVTAFVVFLLVSSSVFRFKRFLTRTFGRASLYDQAEAAALEAQVRDGASPAFTKSLAAARDLEATIAPLKRAKDYTGMAEAYASVNRYRDAAKWYRKAGKHREAAHQLARDGQTVQAAKLLMKDGDFENAARFFAEKGKHLDTAKAYMKAGKPARAARAYVKARKHKEAIAAFREYFGNPQGSIEQQVQFASECATLLENEAAAAAVPEAQRKELLRALAARFEQTKHYDRAAALFRSGGDLVRAGEVYALAGNFEAAVTCMREAGRKKDAARLTGRFMEAKEQWPEAAAAYLQAGELVRAGECHLKANAPLRAAECFERGGENYRGGVAYARATRYKDAIRTLQQVKSEHASFDSARALLGRCFYELHEYDHCIAALENHLTGKRVDNKNVDTFYMLALAYEQTGHLTKAREVLLKIRSVDVGFRDAASRLSQLSSRISVGTNAGRNARPPASGNAATVVDGAAQSIESALGGRYQLQQELGRGGMGVVYRALDTQLSRPVALKFLGSLVDNSEEYRQRFVREARAAAKINHPNIISIYDISASVGKAYIAMEFVEGPSLGEYIRRKGGLPSKHAVQLIDQACAALVAIHEAGIVHRDIKPDNILINKDGLVKLTDFGLAKADDSPQMTRTGIVIGTPSYMAPEQVKGKMADARSDIYSLGLVLYECLKGAAVFSEGDILERQLEEMPPAPSAVAKGIPKKLDAIVLKTIAKDPDKRFQSVRDLRAALRALTL